MSYIVKTTVKPIVAKQMKELATMMDTLELTDKDKKSLGSGWAIKAIDKLCADLCLTKDLIWSSYIASPSKFRHARCGLVNIKKEWSRDFFKYFMLHHQSEKKRMMIG